MIFRFYLVDNNEIIIYNYDDLSARVLDTLDKYVTNCNCKREDNIITGEPADMMDLLVAISADCDILL